MNRLTRYADTLFFLFLFVLPFQTVYLWREPMVGSAKWQYGTIGIYLSSIILAVAIMIGAILKVKMSKKERIGVRMNNLWRERKTDAFLLLFVLWSGLSILWARDTLLAGYTFMKILLAADAFIMTRDMVRRGKMRQIVSVLFVAAMIQSVIGIGQFLTQETFSSTLLGTSTYESWQSGTSVLKNDTGRFLRAYGTFPHPNMYGLFLAVVLLIVTERIDSFVLTPQSRRLDSSPPKGERATLNICNYNTLTWLGIILPPPLCEGRIEEEYISKKQAFCNRIVILFGILIILLGLILSFSRLAWGGFALGFIFLAWRSLSNTCFCHPGLDPGSKKESIEDSGSKAGMTWKYPLAIFATVIIATAIFTGILRETVFPRFDGGVVDREGSVVDRMSTYRDAFQIVRAHPFLGVGAGNETAELIRLSPGRPIWDIQPAHDVPLLILSELGIPGFVFSLCFFWFLLSSIMKKKGISNTGKSLAIAVLPSILPSLLLDHFLWDSNFGLLFLFVLLGLTFDTKHNLKKP
ncbi:MAG: O-antigen ligase family protein [Candidatus Moraniibacteriota bacterium]